MNGKGDSPRPANLKVYRENFDAINWRKPNWRQRGYSAAISHLDFMRSMGFYCKDEQDAYELRGLLDM